MIKSPWGVDITMAMSSKLEKAIDAYLNLHSEADTGRIQPLELSGKRIDLKVLRIPTELLRYNISNGRFAAEYADLKNKVGRELDPDVKKDAIRIRNLLLDMSKRETQLLREDLVRIGQLDPGVMTFDGSVINGNRRMAIFEQLFEETGDAKWSYLDMVRLPPAVNEKDLWRLEANLQFSRDERAEYGPINRLLKFRIGVKAGLSPKQIAASMYGGFSEKDVKEDLERLKLIETYLEYIGKPGNYKAAERVHEHFNDLRKIIVKEQKNGMDPIDLEKIVKFTFDMIRKGSSHWDIRKISDIIREVSAKENLLNGIKERSVTNNLTLQPSANNEAESVVTQDNPSEDFSQDEDESGQLNSREETAQPVDSADEEEEKVNPDALFQESLEIARAEQNRSEPLKLLTKALTNLQTIEIDNPILKDLKAHQLIEQINSIVQKLVSLK